MKRSLVVFVALGLLAGLSAVAVVRLLKVIAGRIRHMTLRTGLKELIARLMMRLLSWTPRASSLKRHSSES